MKRVVLYILLVTMIVVGCAKRTNGGAMGELAFEGFSLEVESQDKLMLSANTKAEVKSTEPLEVVITNADGKVVANYPSHLLMPLTTPLPEGSYTIKVQSANRFTGVRFDTPQYASTQTFEIKALEVTRVSVLCRETTASVVVKYDNLFRLVFDEADYEYWAVLTSSLGDQITLTPSETKVPYFNLTNPDIKVFCQIFLKERATGKMLWGDATSVIYPVNPDPQAGLVSGNNYSLTIKVQSIP